METFFTKCIQKVAVQISAEESRKAKALAKAKGMTYQGWIGSLIKREIYKEVPHEQRDN